jgi:translocator protein
MNSSKTLLVGNILALVVVLIINVLANLLPINGMNTGQISDLYPSLFTPAGFTFSIWSVIYLLQIGFVIVQFRVKDESYFRELSLWFWLSCIANFNWILVWQYLFTAASVAVMLVLLFSLTRIFLLLQNSKMKNRLEWVFIKLPFVVYLAWICVATIANISALLVSLNWSGGFLSNEYWTIIMISIAALLGLFIAYKFKEPAFLLVLIWAFFGIYSKWITTEHEMIAIASRVAGVVLAVVVGKLIVDARKNSAKVQ